MRRTLFLASDLSSYVSGVEIPVDGGATSTSKAGYEEHTIAVVKEFVEKNS